MRISIRSNIFRFAILSAFLVLWMGLPGIGSGAVHAQNDKCYDPQTQKEIPCPPAEEDGGRDCKKNDTCGKNETTPTPTETAMPSLTPSLKPSLTSSPTLTFTPEVIKTDTPTPPVAAAARPAGGLITSIILISLAGLGIFGLIGLWVWFGRPMDLPVGGVSGQAGGDETYSTFERVGEVDEGMEVRGGSGLYKSDELE